MDGRIPGFKGEYLWELELPSKHVMALAEAFPTDKYEWRPGKNVRSVSEVFVHVALGNFLLLDMAGVRGPEDLYGHIDGNLAQRVQAIIRKNDEFEKAITNKADVVILLKRSLEAVRTSFTQANDAELTRQGQFFGEQTTVRRVYLRMLGHMNEHVGQLVAYARSNNIPVPWPDWRAGG